MRKRTVDVTGPATIWRDNARIATAQAQGAVELSWSPAGKGDFGPLAVEGEQVVRVRLFAIEPGNVDLTWVAVKAGGLTIPCDVVDGQVLVTGTVIASVIAGVRSPRRDTRLAPERAAPSVPWASWWRRWWKGPPA